MKTSSVTHIGKAAPSIFIIFGVTGDLAAKKIIPSLWHLYRQGRLPEQLSVIGFARRKLDGEEFRKLIRNAILTHRDAAIEEKDFSGFFSMFAYHAGTFEDEEAFRSLSERIKRTENDWGICANKLFYLAAPPVSYESIFQNLAAVKLNVPCGGDLGWSRVLIEKPFGSDLKSARSLQSLIASYFKESQVYRIDHYLFKEIVQGIENFRFSNNLFEHTWDNTTIERIHIRLLESIGVEGRGSFYDSVGAFRDVGQNHLLEMLAVLTMERPRDERADTERKNRARILKMLAPWSEKDLAEHTFRAQYRGYRNIKGVRSDSQIETYFALKTEIIHPKWSGVPIYLEAGKRMGEARKEIVLTLKHPSPCFLCKAEPHEPNRIIFRLEPNDEIVIHFWAKKPGFERVLEERTFSFFLYKRETKRQYVEEYAKVLHAAIEGNRALFVAPEEIEALWMFTDPVVAAWKKGVVPLRVYEPDTTPEPALLRFVAHKQEKKQERKERKTADRALGIIGLGKMGANLARQLMSKNWNVVGYNRSENATKELEREGLLGAYSEKELVEKLKAPRTVWLMVPYGAVDAVLEKLIPFLEKGDTVIDGGNSPYQESVRRYKELSSYGIHFLDVGVSGGPAGALNGACVMVGGDRDVYERHEPLFRDISVSGGYGYMGKSGSGHFVKMVHNGIEYGMMQALAEGFTVMKKSSFSLNLRNIAELYNHGSVIESRLVGWLADAYAKYGEKLDTDECCSGTVAASGEGAWTVETARKLGIPVAIIEGAVRFRAESEKNPSYTGRILSALRHMFGGHDVRNKN